MGEKFCRHQWDTIVIRPSAVGDTSCTRRPECGDDPSTAMNGRLPLYDETADRVEVDRCMTTSGGPYGTQRRGLAITHCEVCRPLSRRCTCCSLRGFTVCSGIWSPNHEHHLTHQHREPSIASCHNQAYTPTSKSWPVAI